MNCAMCRSFILDHLHHPLHPEDRLTAIFHLSSLLRHKEILCFWIQRIQSVLTPEILRKTKEDTEMDFWIDQKFQIEKEDWNKAYLKNLTETRPHIAIQFKELQTTCEECAFLSRDTESFFLENYILPLLLLSIEIHTEHTKKPTQTLPMYPMYAKYTMSQLREEYGNLYD